MTAVKPGADRLVPPTCWMRPDWPMGYVVEPKKATSGKPLRERLYSALLAGSVQPLALLHAVLR